MDRANSVPGTAEVRGAALQIIQRHYLERTLGLNWGYHFIKHLPPHFEYLKQKPSEKARYEAVTPGYLVSWYDRR